MKPRLLLICLLFAPLSAWSAIEAYEFESAQMKADYNRLINELRCLVCQNQNLAGSDAALATDLRRETYQMLSDGKTPQEVVDFMVARYGDFVLYRPQFKTSTYLLWLGPFLLMVGVLIWLIRRLRDASEVVEVDADALARARDLLESNEKKE